MLDEARMLLAQDRVADAARTLEQAIDLLDARDGPGADAIASLTPAEARVARMAGSGMKNREIADELRVSIKAVEYHLANTFRKLGIRSRIELAGMFSWAAPLLSFAFGY
jgi:DNA-binding NarL/FixJ family response regulator